jgi:uncharacterized membrane protein
MKIYKYVKGKLMNIKPIVDKINDINKTIAILITNSVATMWCAYLFAIIAFISLPEAIKGGVATLISWIAQTFLQLVLLSIIMVGQAVLNEKTEKRADEDHETLLKELQEIKAIHELLKKHDE